jgi:hypothetical protein
LGEQTVFERDREVGERAPPERLVGLPSEPSALDGEEEDLSDRIVGREVSLGSEDLSELERNDSTDFRVVFSVTHDQERHLWSGDGGKRTLYSRLRE